MFHVKHNMFHNASLRMGGTRWVPAPGTRLRSRFGRATGAPCTLDVVPDAPVRVLDVYCCSAMARAMPRSNASSVRALTLGAMPRTE